ncbi:MAG: hypothetical protein GY950_21150, partial [bacterium]|nr:hypothetical protein [bacterium]
MTALDINTTDDIKGKVLFYKMDESIISILKKEFLKSDIVIFESDDEAESRKILKKEDLDVILADYDPHKQDTVKFLEFIKKKFSSTNRILLSD